MSGEEVLVRCAAATKSGSQCKNYAKPGLAYCHVHEELAETAVKSSGSVDRLEGLVDELDGLVADLKTTLGRGEKPRDSSISDYPVRMLTLIRDMAGRLAPDVQLGMLESFEGMTVEDAMDLDTWKGMAYMLSYSAKFQAGQARDKMNDTLPESLQPGTMIRFVKGNVDRFTPEVAKELLANFEGATKEDLLDPDTWKGVWYMLNYSLQFQAEQMKQRLIGEGNEAEGEA
ncbi:MAG: hypothetical protein IAF02_10450 [Anaerolineae bacterium]|nr:hypothetical protein [Anaerolineae bacterium]